MGLEERDQVRIANMLNCKIGDLPLVYLGIPVSDKHLGVKALRGVPEKLNKRLQPWKGKNMTSRGRLMLTNTSLSSLPIYTMGVYRLQDSIHQQMDTTRAKIFWQGASDNFKYHMVKWPSLCIPKDYWGLGIMDTKTMNEALLGKWCWRMLKANPEDQCYNMLKNKYLQRNSFLQYNILSGSQFWKGILKSRDSLRWGCKSIVNNGLNTRFWEDVWAGDIPLKLDFPNLYELSADKGILVGTCSEGDGWNLNFKRPLGDRDFGDWESLMNRLDDFRINEENDQFVLLLDKSRDYSTRSMYRRLIFRGVLNKRMIKLWKSKLPYKLKVFLWLAVQDRLQTGVNLKKRKWRGSGKCCLCGS